LGPEFYIKLFFRNENSNLAPYTNGSKCHFV
jgi:hypothetical protein